MGVIQFTADAYARIQKTLLPPGRLWSLIPTSFLTRIFLGSGDELARVSGRSADLVEEGDIRTTTELITENESELALPSTGTLQERRDRAEALRIQRQRFRPSDVKVAVAPYLALDVADIDLIETSNAAAVASGDEKEVYRFFVYRDPALAGTPDIAAAQVELDRISHSHTQGHIIESIDFLCDDPESLTDRDLLGI